METHYNFPIGKPITTFQSGNPLQLSNWKTDYNFPIQSQYSKFVSTKFANYSEPRKQKKESIE